MYARNVVGVFVIVSSSSISVPVENVCDSCCVSSEEVWFRLNFDINGDFRGSPRLNSSVGGNVVLVDVITVVVVVAVVDVEVVRLVVFRRFGLYCGRFVEVFLLNL